MLLKFHCPLCRAVLRRSPCPAFYDRRKGYRSYCSRYGRMVWGKEDRPRVI